jgi:acetylornithine/LysW-gamma-L-lysine aminotransferase
MGREAIALEEAHGSGLYVKQPLVLTHGEGARIWDADGNEYIDCTSGHGVANIGHANPAVLEAVAAQAARLVTAANGFYNDQRARLLAELARIAPPGLERTFLCNSGAEAVEAAFKFARLATGRTKIVSTMRGFHGRTMGALSATWNKGYREPFEPLVPGFEFVPHGNLARMEQAVDGETAGVILEVVQGEGGVHPGAGDHLRQVQKLCADQGALFIVDEVQTGFGRTGKMFACEHYGLQPDLMCIAKAMAAGVPMGGVMLGPRVGDLPKKVHGSTFGGNPLACAAALASIEFLDAEDLPSRAARLGERFLTSLSAIHTPMIREVRGLGLMIGIQLRGRAGPYLAKLSDPVDGLGVLALTAGSTVMRLLPPLVMTEDDVDLVVARVANAVAAGG